MSIVDKKKEIFGQIAATKTLIESLPKLKLSSLFPSINNGGDSILFLTDLIKSLIGYEALVASLVNTLTFSLTDFEDKTRKGIKHELKNIVGGDITNTINSTANSINATTLKINDEVKSMSNGIDPKIPDFIKSDAGMVISVDKIDFFDLFKINPNSTGGKLLYSDITSSYTNSSDFNTFMYGVIQNDGVTHKWKDIFYVTFNSVGNGVVPNNTLTIKATETYSSEPKTLTDLNNDFMDSITLFSSASIVNSIIDAIFGSVSVSVNKTSKQLETEAKVNNILDCLINSDDDEIIDDSYFSFTNEEVYIQQEEADYRKKGIVKLDCCNKISASVPVSFLTDFNNDMSGATSTLRKKEIITTHLNLMAEQNTINSNDPSDHITIKLNFVQNMIQNLIKAMVSSILSPKVIMIFLIKYKITLGQGASFTDPSDFIKQNKNLFKSMIKQISAMVIAILLAIALKQIKKMYADSWAEKQVEKIKYRQKQLLTLIGISQDKIKKLKNLT
jgi:hypothetical protein